MTRVLIATQAWGVVQDRAGNVQPSVTVQLDDLDGDPVEVFTTEDGIDSQALVTNVRGEIPGWVEDGQYDLTAGGVARRVQVVAGPPPQSGGYLSLRKDFSLNPSMPASALQTAIDAAIVSAISDGKGLDLGAELWPIDGDALTVGGSLPIQSAGAAEVWGNVLDSGLTGMPGAAPWVTGGGFVQEAAGANILNITGLGATVHLKDMVFLFRGSHAFNDTGHAVHGQGPAFNGRFDNGPTGCRWDNIVVFGHDGDHYAFHTVNMNLFTAAQLRAYGGGGWYQEVNSNDSNYGNGTVVEPYFCLFVAGEADGYHLKANAAVPGNPGLLNLVTFVRPQCNIAVITGTPIDDAHTIDPIPLVTSQQNWRDGDGARQYMTLIAANFEDGGTNAVSTMKAGTTVIGPELSDRRVLNNTYYGTDALPGTPTGGNNTAFGYAAAGAVTDGNDNTTIGSKAGTLLQGGDGNTVVGFEALTTAVSADQNTALGYQTLRATTVGGNTAVGHSALKANTTGTPNTAVGLAALASATTAANNTAVGHLALQAATTAIDNTAVGHGALSADTTGYGNTGVGKFALSSNTTGGNNTGVGTSALWNVTTGICNTGVGVLAGPAATENFTTALGYGAQANAAGSVAIGIDNAGTSATTSVVNEFKLGTALHTVNVAGTLKFGRAANETTGAGSAALGANCPAATPAAPYTWEKVTTSDGSQGYMPVWK